MSGVRPGPLGTALLIVAVAWLLAGCGAQVLAPTPNLYVAAHEDPFDDVPVEHQSNLVEIMYVTDRVPEHRKDGSLQYGFKRSRSPAFGKTTVALGRDVSWEELVEASRVEHRSRQLPLELMSIDELVRFPEYPGPLIEIDGKPANDPTIARAQEAAEAAVHEMLAERLALTPDKTIYLFVHGYNNTFEHAAFRMAQLWHFMGRQGVPVIYTWPAGRGGLLRGYTYDRESGDFTVFHLKLFLRMLARTPGVERLQVLAHSRGTDVFLTALRELHLECKGAGLNTGEELKLGTVILAAADLDLDVVNQRIGAERLQGASRQLILYMNPEDQAIGIADWLFASVARVGQVTADILRPADLRSLQLQSRHLQMINVDISSDAIGHGYVVSNPAVLSDVILTLRDERSPGAEHGRPLIPEESGFWLITDDYLLTGNTALGNGDPLFRAYVPR